LRRSIADHIPAAKEAGKKIAVSGGWLWCLYNNFWIVKNLFDLFFCINDQRYA